MPEKKIKIAVSSCLLGEAVRYDGTDKHTSYITQHLAKEYNLISICPEMGAGMGVPRPAIHIVDINHQLRAQRVDDSSVDVTDALTAYAEEISQQYQDICGYILKKNSPSCGLGQVKVLNSQNEYEFKGRGIYIDKLLKLIPALPVIDEEDCLNQKRMDTFLSDVSEYSKNIIVGQTSV